MTDQGVPYAADAAPGDEPRLQVEVPRQGLTVWMWLPAALVLTVGMFLLLESRREARLGKTFDQGRSSLILESPPPLAIPSPPERRLELVHAPVGGPPTQADRTFTPRVFPTQYLPPVQTTYRPVQRPADDVYAPPRYNISGPPASSGITSSATGGAMVVDLTTGKSATINGTGESGLADDDDAVRATLIRNRSALVQQGVVIPAVLETPLDSDRPGMARAIVSQDIRGFDGTRVLIPRGSRLIGEFKADTSSNMRRILVTWSRLIRPDGVAIRIASPSTDVLGGAGIPGSVNTHFLQRFAGAVLQSTLVAGVNLVSQLPRNGSGIYVGLPGQISQVGQDLVPDTKRPPTIKVKAGAEIAIFVAHDLDFGGTPEVR